MDPVATDHDVLRGRAFQPHRIDDGIKEDGKGQQPRRQQVGRQRQHHHRQARQRDANAQRLARLDLARRNRTVGRAFHDVVDVRIPPHVQRTRGPGPDGDEQNGRKAHNRVHTIRRRQHAHKRCEHHKLHHARLHQREIIAKGRFALEGLWLTADVGHAALTYHLDSGKAGEQPPPRWLTWKRSGSFAAGLQTLRGLFPTMRHRPLPRQL